MNDWIYLRLKRPEEGYEDVHEQLVLEDFLANPIGQWVFEILPPPAEADQVNRPVDGGE